MTTVIGSNFYIKPTYLVRLPEFSGNIRTRSEKQLQNELNLKSNDHNGRLSSKSSRKLLNAVNWLVSSAKQKRLYSRLYKKVFFFKINFITLTIPYDGDKHVTEKTAKAVLHSFLAYSRKYFYLRNYVWKFEVTKKGQLHIHITTDTYINHARLRECWNRLLRSHGLLDSFYAVSGHYSPNSTDIHAVKKVKDIAAYIAKYMAKSGESLKDYKGRIWGCNRELSEVNSCHAFVGSTQSDISQYVLNESSTRYKPIMSAPDAFGNNKKIGEIYFMNEQLWQSLQKSIIKEAYDAHRFHIRNNIAPMPREYWEGVIDEYFSKYNKNENTCKIGSPEQSFNEAVRILNGSKRKRQSDYYQAAFEEMLA